jgi:hypothetical protein
MEVEMTAVDRMFADSTDTIAPDLVAPAQVFCRARGASGERALMAAVLEDAMRVFRRQAARQFARTPRVLLEVQRWFASRSKGSVFAFERICEELDIDAEYIRRQLALVPQPPIIRLAAERREAQRLLERRVA